MVNNAMKNMGASEALVRKKLKIPHIRKITLYWLWQGRSHHSEWKQANHVRHLPRRASFNDPQQTASRVSQIDTDICLNTHVEKRHPWLPNWPGGRVIGTSTRKMCVLHVGFARPGTAPNVTVALIRPSLTMRATGLVVRTSVNMLYTVG